MPVHEIFSADPDEDVRLKGHTKNYFETGVGLFRQARKHGAKDLAVEASRYFRAVLKAHPADRAADYYVKRCAGALAPSAEPEAPAGA